MTRAKWAGLAIALLFIGGTLCLAASRLMGE